MMANNIHAGRYPMLSHVEYEAAEGPIVHEELDWRPGVCQSYDFRQACHRAPALAHQRATLNVRLCSCCAQSRGPWSTCRSKPGLFRGACTNCKFGVLEAVCCSLASYGR